MNKKNVLPRMDFFPFAGLILGALLAFLLIQPLTLLPSDGSIPVFACVLYGLLMAAGWKTGRQWKTQEDKHDEKETVETEKTVPKILDTSVLIDGRIYDICKAGFLEGELIVSSFVLGELRHIADSADSLRRARGRRGLDVIARMQEELNCIIRVVDTDYPDVEEVDVKLLRLAKDLSGAVLTNDFNLNKVAGVSGVRVMNINELSGALRPMMLPGEEMTVQILKDGKEPGQGIAYLEDGTMVVVENGRRFVGQSTEVVVSTVLQTSAGRMIFSRVKTEESQAV